MVETYKDSEMNKNILAGILGLLLLGCSHNETVVKKKTLSSSASVAQQISTLSKENGIDPIDAYYQIVLESDFQPFTLSMYTKESIKKLNERFTNKQSKPKIKNSRIHKYLRVFHFPSKEGAHDFIDTLKYDTLFSVGLMGVPSTDYGFWEKGDYFNIDKNMRKGIARIKACGEKFKKTRDKIECLSKLSNKDYKKYNYWRAYNRAKMK